MDKAVKIAWGIARISFAGMVAWLLVGASIANSIKRAIEIKQFKKDCLESLEEGQIGRFWNHAKTETICVVKKVNGKLTELLTDEELDLVKPEN